jgi:hypothetical protein
VTKPVGIDIVEGTVGAVLIAGASKMVSVVLKANRASGAMIAPSFEEYLMLWADYATDSRALDNDYQVLAHFGFDSLSNEFQVWWVESIVARWMYEREPVVSVTSGPFGDIDACVTEFRRMRSLTFPEPRYVVTPLGNHEVVRRAAGYPRLMYAYPDRPETWGPTYE